MSICIICFLFCIGFLERDLHLCNITAFPHRGEVSVQHKEVYRRLNAFDGFLPRNYLADYGNPCWWSTLQQPSSEIQSKLFSTRSITTPILPWKKTMSVMNQVFSKTADHKKSQYGVFSCLPAVFLAGFAKSGTTTLYNYLITHPLLRKPAQKEGHFWRSLLSIPMNQTNKQMQVLWYMQHFSKAAQHIQSHPRAITIDASASTLWFPNPLYGDSYFYDDDNQKQRIKNLNPVHYENRQDLCFIPSAVHSVLPHSKFIVIMRNPVKRLFSDFWYFCANKNHWNGGRKIPPKYMDYAPHIFHNLTVKAISEHRRCLSDPNHIGKAPAEFTCLRKATLGYESKDSCFPLRLGVGMYYYHIVKWMNVYPRENFHFLRLEDLATDSYGSVEKIWKFLGFSPMSKTAFESSLKGMVMNEMNWIKLPKYKDRFYMLPETEKLLTSFYEPINMKLAQLLRSDEYLWN